MATFTKINSFVEHLAEGVHNLGADQLRLALTNDVPNVADTVLTDLSDQAGMYANLDSDPTSRNVTNITSSQASGTYTLDSTVDIVLTASGGDVGPFQYIYIYNTAGTGVTDPLIGYYDYGSALTLSDGETLTVVFDALGILTLV